MTPRECGTWTRHPRWWGRIRDSLRWGHVYHVCHLDRPGFGMEHEGQDHQCDESPFCKVVWPIRRAPGEGKGQ
jgi:hypothetical protein